MCGSGSVGAQLCLGDRTLGACVCSARDAGVTDTGVTPPVDAGIPPTDTGVTPPVDAGTGGGSCPAGMIYLPAGSFLMGDPDPESRGAQPQHMVTLSAFCMDLTEVTVAAYRGCTNCTAPTAGTDRNAGNWGVTGRDNHPVNQVDWNQSRAYCQWRGGDLPTEAQWEYAARGSDVANHIYPWGNAVPGAQLCWNRDPSPGSTCPVQSYPLGNSPFGLFDMAGNVFEWTLDFDGSYPMSPVIDPTGEASGTLRVCRGGAWNGTNASSVRAAFRGGFPPMLRTSDLGFRCARRAL